MTAALQLVEPIEIKPQEPRAVCWRCNRRLTGRKSILRGAGPRCVYAVRAEAERKKLAEVRQLAAASVPLFERRAGGDRRAPVD